MEPNVIAFRARGAMRESPGELDGRMEPGVNDTDSVVGGARAARKLGPLTARDG
jgi:hypothetical protein